MTRKNILIAALLLIAGSTPALAKSRAVATIARAPVALDVVAIKAKGGWTAAVIALRNNGTTDARIECCTAYVENDAGYAVQSLTRGDLEILARNRAKTAATIGGIIGAGLGLGGAIGNVDELVYAGIAVAGTSAIAGVAGSAAHDNDVRNFVIDDMMRVHKLPAGLKVAGVVYFPPTKKWPGSKRAKAVHVTYRLNGKEYRTMAPVSH
ncbi:MAG: hypothetical protein HY696_04485 [Deltaproteobacteria bacterium]|nr:hypothetical protein [Deltaproteobacteria bacterium]